MLVATFTSPFAQPEPLELRTSRRTIATVQGLVLQGGPNRAAILPGGDARPREAYAAPYDFVVLIDPLPVTVPPRDLEENDEIVRLSRGNALLKVDVVYSLLPLFGQIAYCSRQSLSRRTFPVPVER